MIKTFRLPALLILVTATTCLAQDWEISGLGGYAFSPKFEARSNAGKADAGFRNSIAAGVALGNDMYKRWGGEFRYLYRPGAAELESNGQKFSFASRQHLIHYDMLWYAADRGARMRPYFAFGAGIKFVQGVGTEKAFQPLGQYAILTKTSQVLPLVDVGGGVKYRFGATGVFRVEGRYYLSPAADEVISPLPGGSVKGWMHDFIPMIGIGLTW